MREAREALGLERLPRDLLRQATREISLGASGRAEELVDEAIDRLPRDSTQLGPALVLRSRVVRGGRGVADLRRAVELLERHSDLVALAEARFALGSGLAPYDRPGARRQLELSRAGCECSGDRIGRGRAHQLLGRLELEDGRRAAARAHAHRALQALDGVPGADARRCEVLAQELLGDAGVEPIDALVAYRAALQRAEPTSACHRRLRAKIDRIRARVGPFR